MNNGQSMCAGRWFNSDCVPPQPVRPTAASFYSNFSTPQQKFENFVMLQYNPSGLFLFESDMHPKAVLCGS